MWGGGGRWRSPPNSSLVLDCNSPPILSNCLPPKDALWFFKFSLQFLGRSSPFLNLSFLLWVSPTTPSLVLFSFQCYLGEHMCRLILAYSNSIFKKTMEDNSILSFSSLLNAYVRCKSINFWKRNSLGIQEKFQLLLKNRFTIIWHIELIVENGV